MVSDRLSYIGPVTMIARRGLESWSSGFSTSNVASLIGHIPRLDLAEAARAWILRSSCKAQQKDYSLVTRRREGFAQSREYKASREKPVDRSAAPSTTPWGKWNS